MPLPLLLDSNILACVLRPEIPENQPVAAAIKHLMEDARFRPCVPEIVDYELRRKLLHLGYRRHHGRKWARESLDLLDEMTALAYVPLTTKAMRLAAELWAETRTAGQPSSSEESLDVDVILAAQARQVGGCVVTMNERHFEHVVKVFDWRPYQPAARS